MGELSRNLNRMPQDFDKITVFFAATPPGSGATRNEAAPGLRGPQMKKKPAGISCNCLGSCVTLTSCVDRDDFGEVRGCSMAKRGRAWIIIVSLSLGCCAVGSHGCGGDESGR